MSWLQTYTAKDKVDTEFYIVKTIVLMKMKKRTDEYEEAMTDSEKVIF